MFLVFLAGLWIAVTHGLQELTAATFELETLHDNWLIEYYSPQCGHCRQFEPVWQQVSTEWAGSMHFGVIDCLREADLCRAQGVVRYPTVHYLAPGKQRQVVEARSLVSLSEFVRAQVPNPEGTSVQLTTLASWHGSEMEDSRPWFIEFFAPWCGHCQRLAPEWEALANTLKYKVDVGQVNCEDHRDLCIEHGVAALPTLKLYIYNTSYVYEGERISSAMEQYVHEMKRSPIHAWDPQAVRDNSVSLIVVSDKESELGFFSQVATQFLDTVRFYHARKDKGGAVAGLDTIPEELPAAILVKDGQHFIYSGSHEVNELQDWVEAHKYPLVSYLDRPKPGHLLAKLLPGKLHHPRVLVVGILQSADTQSLEALRQLARRLSVDPGILTFQLNSANWADYAHRFFGTKRHTSQAIILVYPKDKHYFSRDANGQLFSLDQPDIIEDAILHADALTPIPLAAPKAPSTLEKVVIFIADHSFGFAFGLLCICAAGITFLSCREGEKELKKD